MKRHLAIFLPSLDGGGAEKVMLALAESFVARGVQCDLVIAMNKGVLLDHIPEGVRLVKLGKRKTAYAVFALACYLRQNRPQVVLTTIFAANITALTATMLLLRPCRVVLREANQTELDIRSGSATQAWLNCLAASCLYRHADAVIAVAESVGRGLVEARLIKPARLHVIRNPVFNPDISHAVASNRHAELLILTCGRLELQKDHATLLRAFARVLPQIDATLMILGEGSLLSTLKDQARELGINKAVTFAGFVRNPQILMCKATLFVLASRFEGMSNVLIEALACRCPIVATDCPGGTRETLANGRYGTLVPVGDDVALANAMLQVLRGEVRFPDASEHLRQFDIDQVAGAYLSVLFPPSQEAT